MGNSLQNYTSSYAGHNVVNALQDYHTSIDKNRNIAPGLPSDNNLSNVIINKSNSVVSYSNEDHRARYVAWRVTKDDIGNVSRKGVNFVADNSLKDAPFLNKSSYYDYTEEYKGSGFDKGHIVANSDRNVNKTSQLETFVYSNALPQSPDNNRGPWEKFESYAREAVVDDNQVFIVAGGIGKGGYGSKGYREKLGDINISTATFKVTLTVRKGGSPTNIKDIINSSAVITPNIQGIDQTDWKPYRTSISNVEKLTGLTFFDKVKGLDKDKDSNLRSAISFTGKMDYKDLPVTYIPYLNELRLIGINPANLKEKPLRYGDLRPGVNNPNRLSYGSFNGGQSGELAYASLAFNPTSLSDAYYKDFNRETLPVQRIYENLYRFTTGNSTIPDSVKKLDSEINYMGLGHRFNRLTKQNIYTTGAGPLGSLITSLSRFADSAIGQDVEIEQKHLSKQARKGSLKKILSSSQYATDDDDQKGLIENFLAGSLKTLEGAALATASYITVNNVLHHLTAGFERDFINSLVQRNETGKIGFLRQLATNAFFGTHVGRAITEANLESTNNIDYKEKLTAKVKQYNPYNTSINADGNLERTSINQPGIIGLTSRIRKMDATKARDLIKPLFEMINPYEFGSTNYKKFSKAIDNIVKISDLAPQISFIKSGDTVSSVPIIKNVGSEYIRKIAKGWDKVGMYLPANVAYWVPNLRESLKLPEFDPTKDLTMRDIVSFDSLTIYTQHYVDKIKGFTKHPLQGLKETSVYLKNLSRFYSLENKITKLESKFVINKFVTEPVLNPNLSAERRAVQVEANKAIGYVKGSNRVSSFVSQNAEYFELLKEHNELARKLNVSELTNPAVDRSSSLKTSSEAIKSVKSARKFIFGLGLVLLTNKFLDDYLFSSPGASLPTQISALFGLKVSNDANDPNNKDLTVARFKFTDTVPSQVMWGLAATTGLVAGKLFPDIRDMTFRVGGVYDLLTGNIKSTIRADYAQQQAALPDVQNAKLNTAKRMASGKVSEYNLEVGKLKTHEARRLSGKFNVKAAGILTLGVIIGTKALFAVTAAALNFFLNKDEGVTLKDNKAMTIALLNRLTRDTLDNSKAITGQNILDTNRAISISSRLSNFTETPNRTYSITNQTTTPFIQLALLSQVKPNTKLGGKDNEDRGVATFGVSFQLLPISGLGFTLTSPIGLRLKNSRYNNLYSQRTENKNILNDTHDYITGSAYSAVNFLTLGKVAPAAQFAYVSGTGFDQLLMSSGAVFATSVGFDYLHSFARPTLIKAYGDSSRIVREFDALMEHTKAARAVTYGAYRFSDRALGFMTSLPVNTVKATGRGLYNFFAANPDTNILEQEKRFNPTNRTRKGLSLLRGSLAFYLPLAVARILSDPANGFVGTAYEDPNYQLAATLQVGLATGLIFHNSGIFASGEQLAADFRLAVQLKGTSVNQYHGARRATDLNNTIDSIFDTSMTHRSNIKGVRRFTPTGILFRLAKNTLYEQGVAIQAARGIKMEAPQRLLGSKFGGSARFMFGAALVGGMVLASQLLASMFANNQDLDNFYRNNPFAPGIRLLANVEPKRNNVDQSGFERGTQSKQGVNGIGNFVSNLSKSLTFGLLDIGKLTGLYADTANPFFSVGPFGASFKQTQTTGYTQFASSFSDLSTSAYDLIKSESSVEDLSATTRLFRGGSPRSLNVALARIRGAAPREKPMKIKGVSMYAAHANSSENIASDLYRRRYLAEWLSWQRSSELSDDIERDLSPWDKGAGAFGGNVLLAKVFGQFISNISKPYAFLKGGTFTVEYPDASNKKDTKGAADTYLNRPKQFNNVKSAITPWGILADFSNFGMIGTALSVGLLGFSTLGFLKGATDIVGTFAAMQAGKDALTLYQESRLGHLFKYNYEFGVNLEGKEPYFYQKVKGSASHYRLPLDYDELTNTIGRNERVGGLSTDSPTKINSLTRAVSTRHKAMMRMLGNYFMLEGTTSFSTTLDNYLDYSLGADRSKIVEQSNLFKSEVKASVVNRITTALDKKKLHTKADINLFQALYQHTSPDGKAHFQDFMAQRINPLLDDVVEGLTEHLAITQRGGVTSKSALRLHAYSFLQKNASFNQLLSTLGQPLAAELPINQVAPLDYDNLNAAQKSLVDSIVEKPWSQNASSTLIKSIQQSGSLLAKWVFVGKQAYEMTEATTIMLSGTSDPSLRLAASRQFVTTGVFTAQAVAISKLITFLGAKNPWVNAGISGVALLGTELLKRSSPQIRSFESNIINNIAKPINFITKGLSNITKYVVDPTLDKLFRTVSAPFITDIMRNIGKDHVFMQGLKSVFIPLSSYMAEYQFRLGAPSWGAQNSQYVYGSANQYIRQEYDAEFQQSQQANNPISKKLIHANLLGSPEGALDNIYSDTIFKTYDGVRRVSDEFSIGKTYKISNLLQQELRRRQVLYDQLVMGSSVSHPEWNNINKDNFNTILNRHSFQYGGGLISEANKFIKQAGKAYEFISTSIGNKLAQTFPQTATTLSKENRAEVLSAVSAAFKESKFNAGIKWLFSSDTRKVGIDNTKTWLSKNMPTTKAALSKVLNFKGLQHLDRAGTSIGFNVTGSILGFLTSRVKERPPTSINITSPKLTWFNKVASSVGAAIFKTKFGLALSGTGLTVGGLVYVNNNVNSKDRGNYNLGLKVLGVSSLLSIAGGLGAHKKLYSSIVNLNKHFERQLGTSVGQAASAEVSNVVEATAKSGRFTKLRNFVYGKSLTPKYYLNRAARLGVFSSITNSGFLAFDAYNAFNIDKGIEKVNKGGQFRREYYSNYDAYGASFGVLTATTAIKGINFITKAGSKLRNPLLSIGFIIGSAIVGGKLGDAYGERRFQEDFKDKKSQDIYANQKDWLMAGVLGTIFQLPSIINKSFVKQAQGGFKFSPLALGKNLLMHTGANVAFSVVGNTAFGYGALTNATILSYYDSFKNFGRPFIKTFRSQRKSSPLPPGYYPEALKPPVESPILKPSNVVTSQPATTAPTTPINRIPLSSVLNRPVATSAPSVTAPTTPTTPTTPPLISPSVVSTPSVVSVPAATLPSTPISSTPTSSVIPITPITPATVINEPLKPYTILKGSAPTPSQYIRHLINSGNDPVLKFAASKHISIGFDSQYNFDGGYSEEVGFRFGKNIQQTLLAKLKGGQVSGQSLALSLDTIFHEVVHVGHIESPPALLKQFQGEIVKSLIGKGSAAYGLGFEQAIPANVRRGIMARSRASTVAFAKDQLDSGMSYSDFKKVMEFEVQANTYAYRKVLQLSQTNPELNLDLSYYNQPSSTVNNPTINQEFKDIRQHLIAEGKQGSGNITGTLYSKTNINLLRQRQTSNKFTQYFKGKVQNRLLNDIDKVYFEAPEISTVRLGKYVTGVTSVMNLATSAMSAYQYQRVTYETADQLTEQASVNAATEVTQQVSNIFTSNFKYKLIAGFASQALVTGKIFGLGNFNMIKDPYGVVSKYQKQQKEQIRLGHAIYDPFGLGNSARLLQDADVLSSTFNIWGQTKKLAQPMYDIFKDNQTVAGLSKKVSDSRFVNILSRLTRPITNTFTSAVNKTMAGGKAVLSKLDRGVSFIGSQFGRAFRVAEKVPLLGKAFGVLNSNYIKYGLKKTSLDAIAPALDIYTGTTSAYSFINKTGGTQAQYEYDYAQTLTSLRSLEGSIIGRNTLGTAGDIVGALTFNFQAQTTVQQTVDYRNKAGDLYSNESRTAALLEDVVHNASSRVVIGTAIGKAGVSAIEGGFKAYQGYRTLQTLNTFGDNARFASAALRTSPGVLGKIGSAINAVRASKALSVASNIAKSARPVIQFAAPLLKGASFFARFLDPVISLGMVGYGHYKINNLTDTSSKEAYQSAYRTTYKGYGALAGGLIGAGLGSLLGPVGTGIGGAVGSIVGSYAGDQLGKVMANRASNNRKTIDKKRSSTLIGAGGFIGALTGLGVALGGLAVGAATGAITTLAAPVVIPVLLIGAGIGLLAGAITGGFAGTKANKTQPKVNVNPKPVVAPTPINKTRNKSKYKNDWNLERNEFIENKSSSSSSARNILAKVDVKNKFDLLNFLTGAEPAMASDLEAQAIRTATAKEDIKRRTNLLTPERQDEISLQGKVNKINNKSDWLSNIGGFISKGLTWAFNKTNELNTFYKDRLKSVINKVKETIGLNKPNIDYSTLHTVPGYAYMPGLRKVAESTSTTPLSISGTSESIGNLKRGGNDLTAEQVSRLTPLGKYLYQYRTNKYVLALSDVIARAEGTDFRPGSKNFGYDMIIGGKHVGFAEINKGHSFVEGGRAYVQAGRVKSSATGRFQYMDFNYSVARAKIAFRGATESDLGKLIGGGDNPGSLSPAVQDLGFLGALYKRLGKKGLEKVLAGQDVESILTQGKLSKEFSSLQAGDGRRSSHNQGTPEGQVRSTVPFLRERIKARDKGIVSNATEIVINGVQSGVNAAKPIIKEGVDIVKQGWRNITGIFTGKSSNTPINNQVNASASKPIIDAAAIAKQYGLQSLNIVDVQGNAIADYNKKKPPKHPASTIKLVVADLAIGLIDPNKTYVVAQESVAVGEDKYFAGTKLTGAQLIRNSLRDSDNTSNNTLISIMGGETKVTELARKKGYSSVTVAKLSIPNATQFRNITSNEDVTKAMVSILNNNTVLGKIGQESLSSKDRYQSLNVNNEIGSKIGNNSKVIGNSSLVEVQGRKYIITAYIDHNKYKQGQADTPQSRRDIVMATNQVVKLLSSQSSTQSLPALTQAKPSSGYMGSMFPGVSLDKLANYQPKSFQGMNATRRRKTGIELHNKIDFDERVGGGNNAPVISMTTGLATWGKFDREADSGYVKVKTKDDKGRDVEIVYGHLSLNSISKAFGGKNNVQIAQGQSIGNVRLERYAAAYGAHVDLSYRIGGQQVDVQQEMRRLIKNGNVSNNESPTANNSIVDKEALTYYNQIKSGQFDYDARSLLNKSNSLSILRVSKDKKITPLLSLTDPALPSVASNKTTVNINGETYIINAKGKDAQTILDTTARSIDMLTGNTAISMAHVANANGQVTINRQVVSSDKIPASSFNLKSVDVNVLPFKQLLDNQNNSSSFTSSNNKAAYASNDISPYAGNSFMLVRRTGQKTDKGEELLVLQNIVNRQIVGSINVISGVGSRQRFKLPHESVAQSLEPSPEGTYRIEPSVQSNHPGIQGSFYGMTPLGKTANTSRSALGIHLDANRIYAPGTAGCIGILNKEDLNTFKKWMSEGTSNKLILDWGLGTFQNNKEENKPPYQPVKTKENKQSSLPVITPNLNLAILYKEQNISHEQLQNIANEAIRLKEEVLAKVAKKVKETPIEIPAVTIAKTSKYQPNPLADTSMGPVHKPTYAVDVELNPDTNKIEVGVTEPGVDILAQWHQIQGGPIPSEYNLMNGMLG
jgi:endonuclease G